MIGRSERPCMTRGEGDPGVVEDGGGNVDVERHLRNPLALAAMAGSRGSTTTSGTRIDSSWMYHFPACWRSPRKKPWSEPRMMMVLAVMLSAWSPSPFGSSSAARMRPIWTSTPWIRRWCFLMLSWCFCSVPKRWVQRLVPSASAARKKEGRASNWAWRVGLGMGDGVGGIEGVVGRDPG